MNKKSIIKICMFALLLSLIINAVSASQVYILNFNYDNGKITLKDQLIANGFYPDRNIDIINGHRCELVSGNDELLYSFEFNIPDKIYTDVIIEDQINGGVIILDKTDFSFITPYFGDTKNILCYNERGFNILSEDAKVQKLAPKKYNFGLIIALILSLIVVLIVVIKKRR